MTAILTVTMNPALDLSIETARVRPERKLRCAAPRRDPGGGGINVARVLGRLGLDCTALYPAGGPTGALLGDRLAAEGVRGHAIPIAGTTRENVTVRETDTGQQYRFVVPGPALDPAEHRACLAAVSTGGGLDWLVASGSLPPDAPADLYRDIALAGIERGARIVLDSAGPALDRALGSGIWLVKPNLRELSELLGRALEDEDEAALGAAARGLAAEGAAEVVALSLGHRGALVATRDLCLHAPAITVAVESAVGAGDSFVAGMVWRLAGGAGLREAFAAGVAAGTAALLTPGTELCRAADVERLLPLVRLRDLTPPPGG